MTKAAPTDGIIALGRCEGYFETNGCPSKATTAFLAAVKKFVRNAGTTKQKNRVGTSLRRLAIKTSSSLQRSVGSAIVAYRRVCQKGAGSEGA
jgi:hypothetical protein